MNDILSEMVGFVTTKRIVADELLELPSDTYRQRCDCEKAMQDTKSALTVVSTREEVNKLRLVYLHLSICAAIFKLRVICNTMQSDYAAVIRILDIGCIVSGIAHDRVLDWISRLHALAVELHDEEMEQDCWRLLDIELPELTMDHGVKVFDDPISQTEFVQHMETPMIIKNVIQPWPCFHEWRSPTLLMRRMGILRIVPVEVGSSYTDPEWKQQFMTTSQLIAAIQTQASPKHYLAQHDVFKFMSRLRNDIIIPDYCYATNTESEVRVNAWIGPEGTVTPLHRDPFHNLFAQIVGFKHVRLYKGEESSFYPYPQSSKMENTSQVDIDGHTVNEFPLFPWNEYLECILKPGDLLFIPKGVWHHVRSLSPSISISLWF